MKTMLVFLIAAGLTAMLSAHAPDTPRPASSLAPTPPMGWNSYSAYGDSVREDEVMGNADYMAAHLKNYGWEYIVIDFGWYIARNCPHDGELSLDEYGRCQPAPCRFPSAAGGKGFKPLADYVHGKGLKFGIHIMRGISRTAVEKNLPIWGSRLHASDVADKNSVCPWLVVGDYKTYGIDTTKPQSQAWYDSLFRQYAEWGVDFVKVDDVSYPYHAGEIEQIRRAIDACGRPVVLSLSPGPTPIGYADHVKKYANMWRISIDVFDRWINPLAYIGLSPQTGRPTTEDHRHLDRRHDALARGHLSSL